jgi:hypothetical protein
VTAGEIRPIVEGATLAEGTELVRMKPAAGANVPIYEVESIYKREPSKPAAKKKGPVQVASTAYRTHWDEIFATHDPEAPKELPKGALN